MTSRERILTAMRLGIPDRVPVIPDISNMVPARLTGKPFWDIYYHNDPPLDEAYLEAVKHFGMDGWYIYDNATMYEQPAWQSRILEKNEKELRVERWTETPFGRLEEIMAYPVDNPPWPVRALVRDIDTDLSKLRWYMENKSLDGLLRNKGKIGDRGIYGVAIETFMGFWVWVRDGGSTRAIMDFAEFPDRMDEAFEFYSAFAERAARAIVAGRPDEILIAGSSSSLSLSSPRIYKKYDLPIVKTITSLCKAGGVIAHQHTCGRSRMLVEINYNETDLNVMEPLERPPGGDVDIAEVKKKFGGKLCLKGNVNTYLTMLGGTVADVKAEAKACIDAAAAGGGFILSTGDQCGRDTPDENLFALVEVAKSHGKYH
jgi:uroporphyrinogen decarboxylase